eukprot:2799863-Lingulodinium_polyedra.AAC.1
MVATQSPFAAFGLGGGFPRDRRAHGGAGGNLRRGRGGQPRQHRGITAAMPAHRVRLRPAGGACS